MLEYARPTKLNWMGRAAPKSMERFDRVVGIVNETVTPQHTHNYRKGFIGLHNGSRSNNIVRFVPRKKHLVFRGRITDRDPWIERLEEAGLTTAKLRGGVRISLKPDEFVQNEELLREFLGAVWT